MSHLRRLVDRHPRRPGARHVWSSAILRCAARVAILCWLTGPALAHDGVAVRDAYLRTSGTGSAAAFMEIENHQSVPDRLISASSDAARRVTVHSNAEDANGVMQMRELTEGIEIPGGGTHALTRGGDHLMFTGLSGPLEPGDRVSVTLVFEHSGELVIEVPIDNARAPTDAVPADDHQMHSTP